MSGPPDEAELADRVAALEEALRALQEDRRDEASRARGELLRPPTPGEVIRFADEAAIPLMITLLEANIRLLETIQRTIRLAGAERAGRSSEGAVGERALNIGEDTIRQLDGALSELQRVLEGTPQHDAAADVLEEAAELRAELDRYVRDARRSVEEAEEPDGGRSIPIESGESEERDDEEEPAIDVDAELESIKRDFEERDGDQEDADGSDAADGESS